MKKVISLKSLPKRLSMLPSPKPSAGVEAYEKEIKLALKKSKLKKQNYDLFLTSKKGVKVDYLPVKMDIENVSRCNFRCSMCVVSSWDKGKRSHDMSFADFKNIIDEQYGLTEIKLQGLGEPSLQKNTLFEMIKYARSKNIWVRTTTNASLLHKNNNYMKYIDSDTNEIQISIDGSNKEVFEEIRKGGLFDKICDNCKLINEYSLKKGVVRTKMWTVVQQKNYHQLEELVELGSDLGFLNMVFSLDINGWGIDAFMKSNERESVNYRDDIDRFLDLVELGNKKNINVYFWVVGEKYDTNSVETLCPWPFERLVISSDMRIVPCCTIGNPDIYEFRKSKDSSTKDVWFNKQYQNFRKSHLEGNLPSICKSCYK